MNNVSNFTLGETRNQDQNHFLSLNRQAMESVKGDPMSDSRSMAIQQQKRQDIQNLDELKKDIRKSHFNLGGD